MAGVYLREVSDVQPSRSAPPSPPHGIAFKDGAPGMELVLPGQDFSRTFSRPGVYDYGCAVHPCMTGRVTVRAP